MLNVLWGALCERTNIYLRDEDGLQFTDDDDINIKTDYNQEDFFQVVKEFKRPHARIGCFLTGYGRVHISKLIEPIVEDVYRIHTDGFYTTAELPTSNVLGELKLEKEGRFNIRGLNDIIVLA
jgi:hypothetical protein